MKEYCIRKKSGRKKRMRLLAMLLAFCLMFTTCPDIPGTLYVFAAAGQEEKDAVYVAGFDHLPEDVKEQTVSIGTGLEELTLPDTLEASVLLPDGENDAEDAGWETEEAADEEADTEAADMQTEAITGVTWTSEPEYDGNTEGTYTFTAVLPEGYALMDGVSLPQITVTVWENEEETEKTEDTEDTEVLALLDRIAALPDLEEYLAAEPDMDEDEDAYDEWLETLYAYAEEAPAIWEEYEILTEEQKAQIPETELAKLTTWVEFAETLADSMAVMTVATTVASGTCGSGVTWRLDDEGTLTISGSGAMSSFLQTTMPWYSNITDIKTVTIENGVTSIGNHAFRGCSSLESITIPSGVTSIGTCAFYDCSSLTSIEIPESVTSIGTYAFRGCSLLESITIPSGVTSIGNYTFFGCSSLTSIEIPKSVTSIGTSAFHNCSSLALVIMEGESPATLGSLVFNNCKFVADSRKDLVVPAGTRSSYVSEATWSTWANYIHEDHDSITWTAWTDSTSLPTTAGNYYLATDVTLGAAWTVPSGTTKLCLNGHTINISAGNTSAIFVGTGNTLNLYDCQEDGTITANGSTRVLHVGYGTLNLYGGTVTNGITGVYVGSGTFNMYGGYIKGNTTSTGMGVSVADSKFAMYGGSISGNNRGVMVDGQSTLELSGNVVISENESADVQLAISNASDERPPSEDDEFEEEADNASCYVTGELGEDAEIGIELYWFEGNTYPLTAVTGTNDYKITQSDYEKFTSGNASYPLNLNANNEIEFLASYTVTYDYATNGGTSATKTTAAVAVGDAIDLTPAATKAGWTFVGWNTDKNAETGLTSLNMGEEDITLYAIFAPNTYTVTLNGNGGRGGTTLTSYTYGTGATLPTDWTKTGYTFAGWYGNADCTGTAVTEITTTTMGDKEYWAKWTPVSYTITYILDGGTTTGNPTSYTIESSAITLINPTKKGYTFTGWSGTDLTGSGNTSVTIAAGSTGNREYTANWTANSYNVALHENGGNSGTTLTSYIYGTGAVLPTDWTKAGYTFAGWYDNEGCTGTEVQEISTTDIGDKEYWAKWVDDIAPVIGELSYSYEPKSLWHWLIGKDNLMITVPVTEEGSGAGEITYTVTPKGGTEEQRTAAIKDGEATITLFADFQGTIVITCTDKAGNTSAGVTAGTAQDSDGKGFLIEDNAPEIAFAANGEADISSEYYDAAPDITVTVADDADNAISAGIASITYQIGTGEEIPVNKDFAAQMVTEWKFDIAADDIPTGETKITVTATDNAGNEASETITVKVKAPESKPAAATDYQSEKLTGLAAGSEYKITANGTTTTVTADTEGSIAIDESWLGTTIKLVQTGNGVDTKDSEAQEISFSQRTEVPSIMPELDSRTDRSITLRTIDGAEYRIKDGSWQDGAEFIGLTAGTEYTFTVRFAATADAFASEESAQVSFYTMPSAPAQGTARIDYAQETLILGDGVEAFADEACTTPITSDRISDYIGQTIYIRYAEEGEIPASGATAVTIAERPSAPTADKQDATYPGAQDGKITGLSENTAYEIRKKNDDGTWGEWMDVTPKRTEISDLAPGEYEVCMKAVEGESFQSKAVSVIIDETPATKEEKPNIQIDYEQETLTGFTAGEQYKITVNETTITVTTGTDGTLKLEEEWLGATVSIVKSGNGKDKLDSEAQSISIPARVAQMPTPTAIAESLPNAADGKFTELAADTFYQISTDDGATWTDVMSDENGEITNLAPGSYIVRAGSTDTDFAGIPSASVTIAACPSTYTVTLHGNGGSGTALTSYTYGEGAALPTDWTKTGYTFAGWYDNKDCTGTAVEKISTSDIGDKEYWAKWETVSYTITYHLDRAEATGDQSNLWLWAVLALLAGGMILTLQMRRKKRYN